MKKLARAFPELNVDLTAAEIVAACRAWVPVNARIDKAIEAHRLVFQDGKPSRLSSYALRAVALARTPTIEDNRKMLVYLTGLPLEAWEGEVLEGHSAQEWRDDTLRAITRSLTWMMER
jgi:hypothetical protein